MRQVGRITLMVIAILAVAGSAAQDSRSAVRVPHGATFVPGLGRATRDSHGLYHVRLGNADVVTTHGPDNADGDAIASDDPLVAPDCVGIPGTKMLPLCLSGLGTLPCDAGCSIAPPDIPVPPCITGDCESEGGSVPAVCDVTNCSATATPCEALVNCSTPLGFSAVYRHPTCATDHFFSILYAKPSDRPNLLSKRRATMRAVLGLMSARIYDDARVSSGGAHTARYKVYCGAGTQADIRYLPSSDRASQTATVVNDLWTDAKNVGYTNPSAKYVIFYDGVGPFTVHRRSNGSRSVSVQCGAGSLNADETAGTANTNDQGPSYSVVFLRNAFPKVVRCGLVATTMHETGHTMGAVQNGAPHASSAGHCNDGVDILCYDDGGPTSNYSSSVCTGRVPFDCHYDDYFNAANSPAGYLAGHWNIGASANYWLDIR